MEFVGPVVAVVPLAQTTEGGGRRPINDRIDGRGGYLHNELGKNSKELPKNGIKQLAKKLPKKTRFLGQFLKKKNS